MTKPQQDVFGSIEAMQYLGLDWGGFRYHVYKKKYLKPDMKIGPSMIFRRSTLDEWKRKHQTTGYTLPEAAAYLGVKVNWLRHHLFNTKKLIPDGKRGQQNIFTRETLDAIRFFLPSQQQAAQKEPV